MSFLLLLLTILCYIIHCQSMTKVIAQESKFTHLSSITNICPIVLLFIYHHVIQIVIQDQWLRLASHFDIILRRPLIAMASQYLLRPI